MRVVLMLLSTLFASIAPGVFANTEKNAGMDVLLGDAQYAVNRYQELEGGVVCTAWKAQQTLQNLCSQEQRAIAGNVERIKIVINRASKSPNPLVVDLLDIYDELHEIADRLNELSNNVQDFAHQDGTALAQAAAKTGLLDAKLFVVLRQRIVSLEQVGSH